MYARTELIKSEKAFYSRRDFLKTVGLGAAALTAPPLVQGCAELSKARKKPPIGALYNEKYRPQFHFTPRTNWTNDPDGLVYYKGEYHMFFQHNPFGINWGNMTWAHAISTDLIHWKQLPNAIEPDELGTIFSGGAVVDWNNTSGLQTGKEKVLVAFYTAAGNHTDPPKPFTQCLAYSNDRGRAWVKYEKNPIIGHIRGSNRDPVVSWYEPGRLWVMALFLNKENFALFTSKDLKSWTQIQELTIPGSSEYPDFFEMPIDGDWNNTRWVIYGANGRYLLGTFDGRKFTAQEGPYDSRVGQYYAVQTWRGIPKSHRRRVQIAWMHGGKFPDMPFNQQMSIPCEITLRKLPEGIRLCRVPVREIKKLRGRKYSFGPVTLKPGENILSKISGELFEIQCEVELAGAEEFGLTLRGTPLVYNVNDQTLVCGDKKGEMKLLNGKVKLQILVDRTSIEIFVNDGRASMFLCFPLDSDNRSLEIFAHGGQAKIRNLKVWKLKSIWF